MATETALELDTDAAGYTRSAPVHFGGFPGLWEPGRPVAVSELGFESEQDALDQVDALGLPLQVVEVETGSAPMPTRPNHVLNEEQQRALELEAAAKWPPSTHADADEIAAAANLEWPRAKMNLTEKTEFLEEARAGAVTAEGESAGDEVDD